MLVRNLFGDTTAIIDAATGTTVINFSYDPWGNMDYSFTTGVTDEEKEIIENLCAVTYRGYNYDFDTGLYYLQSRYYNPHWGRFINADDTSILLATKGTLLGSNLFAYCENNPINRVDFSGRAVEPAIFFIIVYILVPLLLVVQKLNSIGLGYLLDIITDFDLSRDPAGVVIYYFCSRRTISENQYYIYREMIDFKFFYGNYRSWCTYLNTEDKKLFFENSIYKTGKFVLSTLATSVLEVDGLLESAASKISLNPIDKYFKDYKRFIKNSKKYLKKCFENDPLKAYFNMYYALGNVIDNYTQIYTSGNSPTPIFNYLYGGDKCVQG